MGNCITGKVRHPTQKDAAKEAARLNNVGVGIYKCSKCNFWHLGVAQVQLRSKDFWQEVDQSGFWKAEKKRLRELKRARNPFSCPKCNHRAPTEGGIREHLKQKHSPKPVADPLASLWARE